MSVRFGRRTLLRGAGVTLALPFLESLLPRGREALAQASTPPRRFVVWFTPNGSIHENWVPTGSASSFTLSRILAPLQPFQSNLLVLDGLMVKVGNYEQRPGDDHQKGMGCMLTGTHLLPGDINGAGLAGNQSIDQLIAGTLGTGTKFRSLELGVQSGGSEVWSYANYASAGVPLPPANDPRQVFTRLFADAVDPVALARLQAERKSVLDAVLSQYSALAPKLGAADRQKVQAHFDTVRELETRVLSTAGVCTRPAAPPALDVWSNANYPAVGKLQMDLMAQALACDLTRVGTLQWSVSVSGVRFTWLGISRGHHDMSHDGDSATDTVENLTRITVWYMEQLAYFLGKLAAMPEGSGTVLDNTLVFCCNELARGNYHSHEPMPYLLAGGAGGALSMGRFLRFTGKPSHNDLLVALARTMGSNITTFGDPSFCSGSLPL